MVPNSLAFCRCIFWPCFGLVVCPFDLLCLLAHCLVSKKVCVEHCMQMTCSWNTCSSDKVSLHTHKHVPGVNMILWLQPVLSCARSFNLLSVSVLSYCLLVGGSLLSWPFFSSCTVSKDDPQSNLLKNWSLNQEESRKRCHFIEFYSIHGFSSFCE